ncbi:hypothetical protein [Solibacillus cecembensis]|uniref:hypothetical protein n=1 Tax=Solibacillus cecembensis TaxID=459347 RepID=UPI003CFD1214
MNVLSVRYSVNREINYQIKTIIYEENGVKLVKKEPYTKFANNHIVNIYENYELLKNSTFHLAKPTLEKGKVIFPFVKGKSFDSTLLADVHNNDIENFKDKINWFIGLFEKEEKSEFEMTAAFGKVFGEGYDFKGSRSLKISNIDSNFDNIILDNDHSVTVIDYEWVFKFPIPLNYIFYRSISGFTSKYELPAKFLLAIEELFLEMGVTKEILISFDKMEKNFTSYIGHKSRLFENYLNEISVYKNTNNHISFDENQYIQLFWSSDSIFNEKSSIKVDLLTENQKQIIEFDLPDKPLNILRLDPASFICIIELNGIVIVNEKKFNIFEAVFSILDSIIIDKENYNKSIICGSNDPQLFLKHPLLSESGKKQIRIELSYNKNIENELGTVFNNQNNEKRDLKNVITELIKKNQQLDIAIGDLSNKDQQSENEIKELSKLNNQLSDDIQKKEINIKQLSSIVQEKEGIINEIKSSRAWKILKKLKLVKI